MKRTTLILALLAAALLAGASPASANQRIIVRTVSLPLLQKACLLNLCSIVQTLDGTLGQVFLVEFPSSLPVNSLLNLLCVVPGVVDAEADVLRNLGVDQVPTNAWLGMRNACAL